MEEMGVTSAESAQRVVDILQESNLTEDEYREARIYLRGVGCIETLGPDDPITWLTPKGIIYLQTEMAKRYPISLDAERMLRYAVEAAPDMGLGIPGAEIMDALKMDDVKFHKAFNQLEIFGLAIWNASYVDPTQEGRQAVLRNFVDPSLVQTKGSTRVIETGGAPYFEVDVDTRGGDFIGRDKIVAFDPRLLDEIFQHIDASSRTVQDKEDLKGEIQEIAEEAQKGDAADETFLGRRLRNLKRMDHDIWDVIMAAPGGPIAVFGMATKKIVEKMKADADKATS